MTIRFAVAENQHASGHQRESKERSDVREISECSDIEETCGNAHNKPGHPCGEIRRLIARMDAAKDPGEKTVAEHGEPYACWPNLEHQQRKDHPNKCADQHYKPNAGDVQLLKRVENGSAINN